MGLELIRFRLWKLTSVVIIVADNGDIDGREVVDIVIDDDVVVVGGP
jgi:hypothetical protein